MAKPQVAGAMKLRCDEVGHDNFIDNHGCAFGQYLKALGIEHRSVGGTYWRTAAGEERIRKALQSGDWTFGALASRLRSTPTGSAS
jgi:arginine utilization protein RocB